MDYSSFYVKNYDKNKDMGMSNINYNNSYYQYYRSEKEMSNVVPEIVYSQPVAVDEREDLKKADYEYYPEADHIQEKSDPKDSGRKKIGKIRICLIFALCIAISCLSTVLATDIMTAGEVISAFKSAVVKKETVQSQVYFTAYIEVGDEYDAVKEIAQEVREQGYGGYATLTGGGYRLYLDISDKELEFEDKFFGKEVKFQNLQLKVIKVSSFSEDIVKAVENYSGYCKAFLDYIGQAMSLAKAIDVEEIQIRRKIAVYASAYSQYVNEFMLAVEQDDSLAVKKMVADMNIDMQALYTVAVGSNASNLICDLRYYAFNAIFNYNNVCDYINNM